MLIFCGQISARAQTLLKLAALRFDFYSGMVLLLSVIVLSSKVRPCQFVRHFPVLQCLVLHFQRPQ